MPWERSADAQVHVGEARSVSYGGMSLRAARIDGVIGARVFSNVVGTAFDEKAVTATMRTETNGEKKIEYLCHAYGVEMEAGDFTWSSKALAFNEASTVEHGRSDQLDEATAKAFMDKMDDEVMKERT